MSELKSNKLDFDILVNKNNSISKFYVPADMIEVDSRYINELAVRRSLYLVDVAAKAFLSLREDAKKEGFNIEAESGFRNYYYQKEVYARTIEKEPENINQIALPGESEHQTGLALDYTFYRGNEYINDYNGEYEESIWVRENAYFYGFILRYPKGKEDITGYAYESWHLRYIGVSEATYIYENDLTLEEYLNIANKVQ